MRAAILLLVAFAGVIHSFRINQVLQVGGGNQGQANNRPYETEHGTSITYSATGACWYSHTIITEGVKGPEDWISVDDGGSDACERWCEDQLHGCVGWYYTDGDKCQTYTRVDSVAGEDYVVSGFPKGSSWCTEGNAGQEEVPAVDDSFGCMKGKCWKKCTMLNRLEGQCYVQDKRVAAWFVSCSNDQDCAGNKGNTCKHTNNSPCSLNLQYA